MSDTVLPCLSWRAFALFALITAAGIAQDAAGAAPPLVGIAPAADADLSQQAQAEFAAGDIASALRSHQLLEATLTGAARAAHREALWKALTALPVGTDFSHITDPAARGWVELIQLAKTGAPLSAYEAWRKRYPDHPGESQIAAGLVMPSLTVAHNGRPIALLLPVSGPLAAAARAIKAGADAAYSRAGGDAPTIAVFDTTPGLDLAAAAAYAQGASALIGPLRKEDVATLASRAQQLPTIALNYLDSTRAPPTGFTPFGLAPEDEARAAADDALGKIRLRAVILAQEGDWGTRAAAAFKARFQARGGTVLSQETFSARSVDYSNVLKRLLGITYAVAGGDQPPATGVKSEAEPSPRSDIDVVFLAARSAPAKLIWPQMRYLGAGGIATYAPASAADGGAQDLSQLLVCDAPWRIESRGQVANIRSEFSAINPRSADAQRLFALGYDAYELTRRSLVRALVPGAPIPGLTGTLVLEPDAAIHRLLECAPMSAVRADDASDAAE